MKYPSLPVAITSLVLALICVTVPVTPETRVLILSVAGLGGALCAYLYAAPAHAISLEKSTLLGASAGLIGGLVGYTASALAAWKAGNADVVFNLPSLNLAIVGLVKLVLAAGFGGLAVGLLSRVRRAAVKEQ